MAVTVVPLGVDVFAFFAGGMSSKPRAPPCSMDDEARGARATNCGMAINKKCASCLALRWLYCLALLDRHVGHQA